MDRQEPDGVGALLLRDGLDLTRSRRVLLADEADEALDVGPSQLLIGPRKPRQLADVRVAASAVPLCEHGQVVVVLRDDRLDEPLQADRRGERGETVVALAKGAEEPLVALRYALRDPLL